MWPLFFLFVGLSVVSYLLRPSSTQTQNTPVAGEVSSTIVDSASNVPILFGTRQLKQVNCVWYGDVGTTPIVTCSSGGGKK